jgi:benzoate 4-monooxygenase
VSNIFSQQSVLQFEPYLRSAIALLLKRWDDMYASAVVRREPQDDDKQVFVFGRGGRVWFDCLNWYNYLAFDIIGDLAFGSPFGMLRAGRDSAPVAKPDGTTKYLPAVEILNYRGTFSASLGVTPSWARCVCARINS